ASGGFEEVFKRHLTGDFSTRLISRPADASGRPAQLAYLQASQQAVSADGRYVVFTAVASFDGAPAGVSEAFLRDTLLGTTRIVSRADGAGGAPADREVGSAVISADGAKVAFATSATNLSGPTD